MGEWWLLRELLVCRPDGGNQAVGGQKLRWNDVVSKDLKLCGIYNNWFELAQDHDSWRCNINAIMCELNSDAEKLELYKKSERKHRRENSMAVAERECGFVVQSKAGLVNHR